MKHENNLIEALQYIDPAGLDYQDWINVGMALKLEGLPCSIWDEWSSRDSARYHGAKGECRKKWDTFNGSASPVTKATIFQMAMERGYRAKAGHALEWGDTIQKEAAEEGVIRETGWVYVPEIKEPAAWDPAGEIIRYLETLFKPDEKVGYVMQSFKNEKGGYLPGGKGNYDRTAGQLIKELGSCKNGDIGAVFGDYDKAAGAWIRFNPLDGNGVKNENVANFRYALVESDGTDIETQNRLIRELELPVAALVYSGKKSIHAIVRVDAADAKEYRQRVEYLYSICKKNGLAIDTQNKNPSRLSRMPGVERDGKKQYLIGTNIGKADWAEWEEWIKSVNDDLPDVETLANTWEDVPELAPELIHGVLRKGHKMLISGPSKAGKSFLLIELTIAIAEGSKWLNFQCEKGRVLYVNLELDRASCLHRFKDVYQSMGLEPAGIKNIDIWNLRGRAVPMDRLTPMLLRRAKAKDYAAVIIDPVYKVITGDENSADQMARFCNHFDRICSELECSTIYVHHHSKGAQGHKKSMDRASGSGVFARDPDALLDMIELELPEAFKEKKKNKDACEAIKQFLLTNKERLISNWEWETDGDPAIWENSRMLLNLCENKMNPYDYNTLMLPFIRAAAEKSTQETAWRIEGTLREFAALKPVNIWFKYPVHVMERDGELEDARPETEKPPWQRGTERRTEQAKEQAQVKINQFTVAFEGLSMEKEGKPILAKDIAEALGVDKETIYKWLGNGKRQDKKLKQMFQIFTGEDQNRYIRQTKKSAGEWTDEP